MAPRLLTTQVLAFTLLGWARVSGRAPTAEAPYPASGTTTAVRVPAAGPSLSPSGSAHSRLSRSPQGLPAGQSDDWSTRLSGAVRSGPPRRKEQPPTTAPSVQGSAMTAPSASVTRPKAVKRPPPSPPAQTATSTERPFLPSQRKPFLPSVSHTSQRPDTPAEPHASSVVYAASNVFPRRAVQRDKNETGQGGEVRIYSSAFSDKLATAHDNRQLTPHSSQGHPQVARRTITIPYQVPQRPLPIPSGLTDIHPDRSRPFKMSQKVAQPLPKTQQDVVTDTEFLVPRLPISLNPPDFFAPTSRTVKKAALFRDQKLPRQPPLSPSSSYRRDEQTANRHNGQGHSNKRGPLKDDVIYSREVPYAGDSSSYEENEQRERHDPVNEASRVPYRRPLFSFPKPIDFGLSKMDQKGCKTTVKELKHVPKDALGTSSSDLHSLFRYKRGAPAEAKMTSIVMTKECFFPDDPADNAAESTPIQTNSPLPHLTSHSSRREYLSSYDPQSRSTHNTPTYDSYYPHPPNPRGQYSGADFPEFRGSKFRTSRFRPPDYGDGKSTYHGGPRYERGFPRSGMDSKSPRGSPSVVFDGQATDERQRHRGSSFHRGWRGSHAGAEGDENETRRQYGHRSSLPDASARESRGPPPPKTMNRSFAFYRRDENPDKDRFVESYSTARRKTFSSDYDSDRDGFFK
ncbi:hypothetical protein HPB48_002984 [Haemaphysalis longicornis]|uniref:Uncharacterized protein n=1 Tax=Haemaphysalis longicornis TaxID=44386 RepID=A0A9J6FDS5_HAELO|nr:hypothetical protein HPB48_002984 [Haemaphysalis longicornis]